jgi:hypothetical protein
MISRNGNLLRSGAATLFAALVLAGCDGGRNSLDPEMRYTGGTPLTLPGPGDGVVAYETFEVCKYGSNADFDYAVTDRATGAPVRSGTVTITDGSCTVLALSGGTGQTVTVTEVVPAGYTLDSVVVTVLTQSGTTTTTVSGPTVTDVIGGGPVGLRGVVAKFYNSRIPTYSIGDFVWSDLNNNGIQDPGEPGLANITVTLSGAASASTQTDVNGYYLFTGLYAGAYTVTVGTPSGYLASPSGAGSDPARDSNGSPASVTLTNADDLTIDFGFYPIPPTTVTLCKVGSAADFTVSVDGVPDSQSLGNGWCRVVHSHQGGTPDQTVVITELVPTGYQLDSIRVAGGSLYTGTTSVTLTSGDAGNVTVTFYNSELPTGGGQGCTPGYWKQSHHFDSWPSQYSPHQAFSSVFANAFPGKTLVQVLGLGGGGLNALGRHTVAALLNAASSGVNYDLAAAAVISAFNAAYASGSYETQKNIFAGYNEQGCPLN